MLEELIGKKVKVREAVKVCYSHKLKDVIGILSFVGKNELLNIELQCTVSRMPIRLRNINQITLWKD